MALKSLTFDPANAFKRGVEIMSLAQSEYVWFDFMHFYLLIFQYSYVIKIYGQYSQPCGYVMEHMTEGTLGNALHSPKELTWHARLIMAEEIAKGIKALHAHNPPVSQIQ